MQKKIGAKTLAVTNVVGSSISREADNVIYTMAGPEIAVASTKAYTTQAVVMNLLGMYLADLKGLLKSEDEIEIKEALLELPNKIEEVLEKKPQISEIAKIIAGERDLFYLGRDVDYALAIEGALKIKEIAYIHSEAYAGGELKHGTIALIEPGTKLIAILTQTNLKDKIESIIFLNINSTYFSVISTSCNGKKCYLIKDKNNESYIDKETGMAVRHIEKNNENDLVIDYDYKFNIVTDNDIKKPDITGYIIEE